MTIQPEERTVILTHGDLDGMVSAILLLTRLGPRTEVAFTRGFQLADALRKVDGSAVPCAALYIADLPLQGDQAEAVCSQLEAAKDRGASLHLYDHHPGWLEARWAERIRPLFSSFHVKVPGTTAAAPVWLYFLKRDPRRQRWLALLSAKDGSTDESVRDDFHLLCALAQRHDSRMTVQAMKALAAGEPVGGREEVVAEYRSVYLPRVKVLVGQVRVFTTRGGRRIGWLDLREEKGWYPGIARPVIERHGVDLAASVTRRGVMLGGAAVDAGTDLTPLHGDHQAGGIAFRIAGHKSPVCILPAAGQMDEAFLAAVHAFLVERL